MLYVNGGFLYLLNEYLNTDFKEGDIKEFHMQNMVPEENRLDFSKYLVDNNIYDHVNFLDDAKEVIEKLNEKYDVYICSSFLIYGAEAYSSKICRYKFEWLQENLPFINTVKYIFCADKSIIRADVKIDDRISNLNGECLKILFEAYHNKNMTDEELDKNNIRRVKGWKEIEKILL